MKKIFAIAAFTSIILLNSASQAEESPLDFAKSRQTAISNSHNLKLEIDRTIDYDSLIENSMDANWQLASEEQKLQIKKSLRSIIRSSLAKRLSKIKSKNIRWVGLKSSTGSLSIVRSIFEKEKPVREQFEIDWVVSNDSGSNKVIDIIFDGVSTVETYRRNFSKSIRQKGMASFVEKLKEKADQNLIGDGDGC